MQCIFTRLLEFKVESFTLNQSTSQVKVATEKCFTPRSVVGRKVVVTKSVVVLVVPESSNLAKVCLQKKSSK